MKKLLLLFAAVALVACDKDDGPDVGTRPIKPTAEVQAFFDENFSAIATASNLHDAYFNQEDNNHCTLFNSVEEFRKFIPGDIAGLPSIDFGAHTLVLGELVVSTGGPKALSNGIAENSGKLTVNLVVGPRNGNYFATSSLYFWGVYEKLPDLPIELNVIYKD